MICQNCGKTLTGNCKFCPRCGQAAVWKNQEPQTLPPAKRKSRRRLTLLFCVWGVAIAALLILLLRKDDSAAPSPSTPEEPPSVSQQTQGASEESLCGDWYCYSGGNTYAGSEERVGVDVAELHFAEDHSAEFVTYVTYSDVYASYSGTWEATTLANGTVELTLLLTGGYTDLETVEPNLDSHRFVLTVKLSHDSITVVNTDASSTGFVGKTFTRDLEIEQWQADCVRFDSSNSSYSLYKTFFYDNFGSEDLVCMADVTHDGADDLIVVHFEGKEKTIIHGYVYTIDENNQVTLIYTKNGGSVHVFGFFHWFIRPGVNGFVLAEESGYWGNGYGSLTFHEYYLTQDGSVCDVSSISVSSDDYGPQEEIEAAFDAYSESMEKMIGNLYALYTVFYESDAL